MLSLKLLQNAQGLTLKTGAEPFRYFLQGTYPFAGIDRIADTIYVAVRGAEVGIVGKNRKIIE